MVSVPSGGAGGYTAARGVQRGGTPVQALLFKPLSVLQGMIEIYADDTGGGYEGQRQKGRFDDNRT
jgi:hypothetical protein